MNFFNPKADIFAGRYLTKCVARAVQPYMQIEY